MTKLKMPDRWPRSLRDEVYMVQRAAQSHPLRPDGLLAEACQSPPGCGPRGAGAAVDRSLLESASRSAWLAFRSACLALASLFSIIRQSFIKEHWQHE